jgi:hypothetical protein
MSFLYLYLMVENDKKKTSWGADWILLHVSRIDRLFVGPL